MTKKTTVLLLVFVLFTAIFGFGALKSQHKIHKTMTLEAVSVQNLYEEKSRLDLVTQDPFYVIHVFTTQASLSDMEFKTMKMIAQNDISVRGVALKEDAALVKKRIQEIYNPYETVGLSINGGVGVDLGVTSPPETLVMSGHKVLHRFKGPVLEKDIVEIILPLKDKIKLGKSA